jgi:hypothetical protein
MKKILNKIAILALVMSFGCADDYLDTAPTDAVSELAVFTTTQNAFSALNGIHRSLFIRYDSQGQPGEGGVMIMREVLAEDVVMTGIANSWFVGTTRWLTHRNENAGDVRFVWRFYYMYIRNCTSSQIRCK